MNDNFEMEEMMKEFLDETGEFLYVLNRNLLQLEAEQGDSKGLLNEMFRAAHSIKGMAGMMELEKMAELTHKIENILDLLRQEKIKLNQEISDIFFKSFDFLESMLGSVAAQEEESVDISGIVLAIKKILDKFSTDSKPGAPSAGIETVDSSGDTVFSDNDPEPVVDKSKYLELFIAETSDEIDKMTQVLLKLENDISNKDLLNEVFRMTHRIKSSAAALGYTDMSNIAHNIENIFDSVRRGKIAIEAQMITTIFNATDIMIKIIDGLRNDTSEKVDVEDIFDQLNKYVPKTKNGTNHGSSTDRTKVPRDDKNSRVDSKAGNPGSGEEKTAVITKKDETAQTLRVDLDKLDNLMNLSGEIVIERARLLRIASQIEEFIEDEEGKILVGNLNVSTQQISRISMDIQMEVMQTRMVPIGGLFRRFGRVVRDIANIKKKKIRLEIEGEETELDKKIVDEMGDPLTHLVRNAADHGIEAPGIRIEKGKEETGVIKLNAYHEASSICIEISDDGKGMDIEAIKEKAVAKGLIENEEADNLSNDEILDFVFMPGFSTAKEITETSGRGVGLDVVKDKIAQLNGNVSIDTSLDEGACFTMRVPLTLAIISCILAKIGEETFAFPIDSVVEIIKVEAEKLQSIKGQAAVTHRDKILPVIYLHEVLDIEAKPQEEQQRRIIIVSNQDKNIGVFVDTLLGREEITIKSLAENLKQVPGIMGASILGNGEVCLIIDVAGLFKLAMRQGTDKV